ncbi:MULTISPECIES: hypothetical protein [unclassified Methylobacterium]|uniref:hypothetical protein n=1 Tax=unclassified Methylobacterium TaxID=2615210 RepID=UPI0011C1D7AA|nr:MULTISPECIES: hypothetical protein [unclassified Methylobacterium]QEE38399.1 hypothetical protein FVA80_04755 [Methylobacterium sp. WL1]TXN02173.1 hypothetical protein FV242_15725 [Methylobacterium sp. WL64]TXN54752.1 hypothetical protein FV241_22815 [Methylobacterium sp. WL2]
MWHRLALLGALALAPATARAYDGVSAYGGYAYAPGGGYPLSLPQTLRGTVAVPLAHRPARAADTLAELYPVLAACWQPPAGLGRPDGGAADIEITARLSLRRDGSLIGRPRITYAAGFQTGRRRSLVRATLDALTGCMPARITPGLGRAIAGRPVALRFVYRPPA